LPVLAEFPMREATFDWPDCDGVDPATVARLLILAKCFGSDRMQGCLRDPLIRDVLRVPPNVDHESITQWLAKISGDHWDAMMSACAQWHIDTATFHIDTWRLTRVIHQDIDVPLFIDDERGLWLFALSQSATSKIPSSQRLNLSAPEKLICDVSLQNLGVQ